MPEQSNPLEQWRPVVGYEGWYEVSDLGRVRRVRAYRTTRVGLILKPSPTTNGYRKVELYRDGHGKQIDVHRLVAMAFHGLPAPDQCVNHINNEKPDNRAANLEWVTQTQNIAHASKQGRKPGVRGERSNLAKLTADQVREIRALAATTTGKAIAARFGVSRALVSMIIKRHVWVDL